MHTGTKFLLLFSLIAAGAAAFWFLGLRDLSLSNVPPVSRDAGEGPTEQRPTASQPRVFGDPLDQIPTAPTPTTDPGPPGQQATPPFTSSTHEGRVHKTELNTPVAGADPPGPTLVPETPKGEIVTGPLVADRQSNIYIVKNGDTLSGIAAARLGSATRWPMIAEANPGLNPKNLRIGDRIVLPRLDTDGKKAQPTTKIYIIRKNDTLIAIARRLYGDSSRYIDIWRANRDTLPSPNSILHPGRRLRLPAERPPG